MVFHALSLGVIYFVQSASFTSIEARPFALRVSSTDART